MRMSNDTRNLKRVTDDLSEMGVDIGGLLKHNLSLDELLDLREKLTVLLLRSSERKRENNPVQSLPF